MSTGQGVAADRSRGARGGRLALVLLAGATLAACATTSHHPTISLHGTDKPYKVNGRWYRPAADPRYDEVGIASWYGNESNSRFTADGERFDPRVPSAAHTTLPLPSLVEVTNLDNGRRMVVRLNDRGPFAPGRLIDLSRAAADQLGFLGKGTARVRVRYVGPASLFGRSGDGYMIAKAQTPRASAAPPPPPPVTFTPPALTPPDLAPPTPAPAPAPEIEVAETPAPPTTAAPEGAYSVQVGAFSMRSNAERVLAQLSGTGEGAILPVERGGATLYRVVLGGFPDEAAAETARESVAARGFADARVARAF